MENHPEYELILSRKKITSRVVFALIGTLELMEMTTFTAINEDESGLIELEKEATSVGLEYSAFVEIFFPWHYSLTNMDDLILSAEHSRLYIEMWHIAISFLKDQNYKTGLDTEAMFIYYNALLITMAKIHQDRLIENEEDFKLN